MNLPRAHQRSGRQPLPWLVLALSVASLLAAERSANMVVSHYAVPEYFKSPHETQMKSLLEGDEAELQSGSHQVLIRGAKWQAFNENGTTQLVVRTPQCYYDYVLKTVSSDSHLEAQSGDGQISFEGEGFLLQTTNLTLTLSNRVQTIISHSRPAASKP